MTFPHIEAQGLQAKTTQGGASVSFRKHISPKERITMKRSLNRVGLALVAVTLLGLAATTLCGKSQPQNESPRPARSRAEEMLDRWNDIGNKLIAMAQDFPEDKYDFKVQKDERTFAQNLLHAAALDFVLIRRISGSNLGPDFGEGDNPSRDFSRPRPTW
jgi:hypothetical protein